MVSRILFEFRSNIKGKLVNETHAFTVTVPGAAAAWVDIVEKFGTLSLAEVLAPAVQMAEEGCAVQEMVAMSWGASEELLLRQGAKDLLVDGKRAPKTGDKWRNPKLAYALRKLGSEGKKGFYSGEIAESIVQEVAKRGGVMAMDDLASHESVFEEPISTTFGGVTVNECAPNGQGLVALIALNILEELNLSTVKSEAERMHLQIESLRLAFADAFRFIGGASKKEEINALLSKSYAKQRAQLVSRFTAMEHVEHGSPVLFSNTVYFAVADRFGNSVSMVNSNYMGFGTGIAVFGFSLQNRGHNFLFIEDAAHPNAVQGGKRPYHTIIPGMLTRQSELVGAFGVMGGFMQPQGHLQVICNLFLRGMSPQPALNWPRFCIDESGEILYEPGIEDQVIDQLKQMGHRMRKLESPITRRMFGRGQIILKTENGGWVAGSETRCDGGAIGM